MVKQELESKMRFSLVTNAASKDAGRLLHIIPHWLRVFDQSLVELCVLVDAKPLEGRIADLHATEANLEKVRDVLRLLAGEHKRLRWRELDYGSLEKVSRQWWTQGKPVRCQAGSPIFAFSASIMEAKTEFVLRADCDMLFADNGWVDEGYRQLTADECDVVSPPRLGTNPPEFSSRAFLLNWSRFRARNLPMKLARLDWLRSVQRRVLGRSSVRCFEDTINEQITQGRIRHTVLPVALGSSMHVFRAEDTEAALFPSVVARWEKGEIPRAQIESGWEWNYCRDAW